MAKLEPVAIQIIGLEDMRRLSAALEQYNQNSPQQAGPLKNELAWFKEANANNLRMIDELHAQLDKSHDRIHQLEQVHDQQVGALTAARNNVDAFQRDLARTQADTSQAIQMLQGKRSATLTTNEVGAMLLREVSAVMRTLESNSVTIRNLQDDHLVKNVGAERLRERLTEANDELAAAYNIIKNRNMRLPDSSYKTKLLSAIADLVDRDVRREIGADHAETKQQLAVALDRIHQLEQVHDQQVAALTAARNNVDALQRDQVREHADRLEAIAMLEGRRAPQLNQTEVKSKLLREVSAVMRALESQPAEANDTHRELHSVIAELRRIVADRDEEIAAAEKFAAKHKPLIEAVRAGHVYAAFGEWVIPEAGTATRAGLYREIKITYSVEDKKCL